MSYALHVTVVLCIGRGTYLNGFVYCPYNFSDPVITLRILSFRYSEYTEIWLDVSRIWSITRRCEYPQAFFFVEMGHTSEGTSRPPLVIVARCVCHVWNGFGHIYPQKDLEYNWASLLLKPCFSVGTYRTKKKKKRPSLLYQAWRRYWRQFDLRSTRVNAAAGRKEPFLPTV